MRTKRILRFYFKADEFERALQNLILADACRSADYTKEGNFYAQRIINLISAKQSLAKLWEYLDGVLGGFTDGEKLTMKEYALSRTGISRLRESRKREIKRTLIKFTRRARRLKNFGEGIRVVNRYYCLV